MSAASSIGASTAAGARGAGSSNSAVGTGRVRGWCGNSNAASLRCVDSRWYIISWSKATLRVISPTVD